MRLAVLASHEGSTLQALIDACASKALAAEVVLVISNNSRVVPCVAPMRLALKNSTSAVKPTVLTREQTAPWSPP